MDILSTISETALITIKARVVEAEKDNPIIRDPIGIKCLERIRAYLPIETSKRILDRKLPSTLTRHLAHRARKYDDYSKVWTVIFSNSVRSTLTPIPGSSSKISSVPIPSFSKNSGIFVRS